MIEIKPAKRNATKPRNQGVYGLVDPRTGKVRYIGTSNDLNYRVYSHLHSFSRRSHTPKDVWIRELAALGKKPIGVLLFPISIPKALRDRHAIESDWIARYHLVGEADLNSKLTPVGHQYGQVGQKQVVLENYRLRKRISELESLLESLNALN